MALRNLMIATLVSAGTLMPVASQAACILPDMKGTWQFYATAEVEQEPYWRRCTLKVDRTGKIANTACRTSGGTSPNLTAGKFALADTQKCTFTAQFKINGAVNDVIHATLSVDKTMVIGRANIEDYGTLVLTMMKIAP